MLRTATINRVPIPGHLNSSSRAIAALPQAQHHHNKTGDYIGQHRPEDVAALYDFIG